MQQETKRRQRLGHPDAFSVPYKWRPGIPAKCDSCAQFILTGGPQPVSFPEDVNHPLHPAQGDMFIVLCEKCCVELHCKKEDAGPRPAKSDL